MNYLWNYVNLFWITNECSELICFIVLSTEIKILIEAHILTTKLTSTWEKIHKNYRKFKVASMLGKRGTENLWFIFTTPVCWLVGEWRKKLLVRNCAAVRPARAGGATRRVFECFIREGERSQNFFVRGHVVGDVF